jgi:Holliday junction resolvase RusA-like endonuclease
MAGRAMPARAPKREVKQRPRLDIEPFILSQQGVEQREQGRPVFIAAMTHIEPQGAPRINGKNGRFTQAAKRYYAYKDELRTAWHQMRYMGHAVSPRILTQFPCVFMFCFTRPYSLSPKKREALIGTPHTVKPDVDNCLKAVLDTMLPSADQGAWDLRGIKRYSPFADGWIGLYVSPELR